MADDRSTATEHSLAKAEHYRQSGQLLAAEDICRKVLQETSDHAAALHLLGIVAHDAGNATAAIDLMRRAVQADPPKKYYFANLGEMCRASRPFDEGVTTG